MPDKPTPTQQDIKEHLPEILAGMLENDEGLKDHIEKLWETIETMAKLQRQMIKDFHTHVESLITPSPN